MAVETEQTLQFEILDHNVAAGYVTLILDVWEGNRHDPVTSIDRYIGVWEEDQLEDADGNAKDPEYSKGRSSWDKVRATPHPLLWQVLETIKKADDDALKQKQDQDAVLRERTYSTSQMTRRGLYQAFIDAIPILGQDETNAEAWEAVEAWRMYNAQRHE